MNSISCVAYPGIQICRLGGRQGKGVIEMADSIRKMHETVIKTKRGRIKAGWRRIKEERWSVEERKSGKR